MKYIHILLMLHMISTPLCYGQLAYGIITQTVIDTDTIQRSDLDYVSDEQLYTTGGVIFTYPVGLFSVAPFINVSIQPTAPHGNTETFTVEVSANDANSATVMVYHLVTNAGVVSISEAPNGSVTVYFLAIADPT
ncbi:MAG TPA: hypothetical protein VKR58_00780 [Aquella sp.]|nr:hypothetical protein [Aquella sp.]